MVPEDRCRRQRERAAAPLGEDRGGIRSRLTCARIPLQRFSGEPAATGGKKTRICDYAGPLGLQRALIEDRIACAIPVDVGTPRVVTGGDRLASGRTRWGNGGAVGYDIGVFVVSCMAVAEGDLTALIMP